MYSLTPRFKANRNTGTPESVAPNTYTLCDGKDTKSNWCPFLSSTERKCGFGKKIYTHALYDAGDICKPKIRGGSSLQSRAERVTMTHSDTPGPAEYDPKDIKKGCKYKPPEEHGRGRLYVCRVPYTLLGCGPSVPTHADANGYDVDPEGNLVKVPPYNYDRTLGPAFYNIPREDFCFTTRKYKGCEWSKSKSKRVTLTTTTNPGPDHYDINYDLCKKNEFDESYREMARYFTYAPRFTEGEMLRMAREALPAPGQYEINTSSFRPAKSLSINPRPFIIGAERFGSALQSDGPGPGDYTIRDSAMEREQFSVKDVPFGFNSHRFSKKKGEDLPGPASYNIKGPIQEKLDRKRNKYSNVDAPFCQTTERKIGFVAGDAPFVPGPGDYEVVEEEEETRPVSAPVFKSATARFRYARRSEDAEPASYNITEPFNKNHDRKSHSTGKVPFHSSETRASGGRSLPGPGPADYLGQGKMGGKGLHFNTSPRFKDAGDDMPGPGYYTIHPSMSVSVYKAISTHNLRLKENVLRTKLRHPPGVTWKNWVAGLNKTKKLKCFLKLD